MGEVGSDVCRFAPKVRRLWLPAHPVAADSETQARDRARDLVVARERTAAVQAEEQLGHLDAGGRHDALELRLGAHAQRALLHTDLAADTLDLHAAHVTLLVAA